MDREEILLKSQKENIYGDEYEKDVRVKRDAFSMWGFSILGMIIMFVKTFRTESPADIISLMFCTSGLAFVYEGMKLKKKWEAFGGVILLLCAGWFFYLFCVGGFR